MRRGVSFNDQTWIAIGGGVAFESMDFRNHRACSNAVTGVAQLTDILGYTIVFVFGSESVNINLQNGGHCCTQNQSRGVNKMKITFSRVLSIAGIAVVSLLCWGGDVAYHIGSLCVDFLFHGLMLRFVILTD